MSFHQPPSCESYRSAEQCADNSTVEIAAPISVDERLADYTNALANWTSVLGIATVALWLTTIGIGIVQHRDTKEALRLNAESIKLATDEFIASHRAKIRVISMRPEPNEEHPIALLMTYVNVGDIDARVEQFSHRFITVGRRHEDKIAPMSDHKVSITLKSGVPENALIVSSNQGDVVAHVAVRAAEFAVEFQCVGYIRYTDAGGAQRRTGFCFAMTPTGAWEVRPNSDYAYEY